MGTVTPCRPPPPPSFPKYLSWSGWCGKPSSSAWVTWPDPTAREGEVREWGAPWGYPKGLGASPEPPTMAAAPTFSRGLGSRSSSISGGDSQGDVGGGRRTRGQRQEQGAGLHPALPTSTRPHWVCPSPMGAQRGCGCHWDSPAPPSTPQHHHAPHIATGTSIPSPAVSLSPPGWQPPPVAS